MNIVIDKKSGIPLYIQVKNQIMEQIKNGTLKVGTKMPTERELASMLNTSRNTISSAYKLLEQEGVIVSYQGKGTFVAEEAKTWKRHSINDKLLKIIDIALEESLEMGLSYDEFIALVINRVKEKQDILKNISAIFIECNIEQAKDFAKQLSKATGLNIIPLTIKDLEERNEEVQKILNGVQVIIATFNHVNEVKELTSDLNKEVLGVAITPCLETIVKIAKYPKGTKFGLVCISNEFQFKVQSALKSAGLDVDIIATTSRELNEIKNIINTSDVVIVSPGRRKEVKAIVGDKREIISFVYNLDQGSVKAVISKMVELKKI
ncbi:GntR family transcriptional regulator [Caloramator proteoclasticus]|uniref:Transcriptional regulator, GntR family n=1 Tax=Caloramator proteoclasticus DSM 10124 TaxID=1121262 RepID=A0A1M4X3C6_9CLOT|nr:GntR family transcriptional regulator [Caloramator proteoclasticus]SHE88008.1 transcriptional regulator, GntR family [Caloramator proteoclasticus DSM 10124]